MGRANVDLSVVVATMDRYDLLAQCLDALSPTWQSAVEPYEVVVVDQTRGIRRTAEMTRRSPFAQFHRLGGGGLAAARNFGVERARADIVAFLDDDAVADRRWVEEMIASFRVPEREWVQMCGGRVTADFGCLKRPAWLKPQLERFLSCIDFGDVAGPLAADQWIVGANFGI